MLEALLGLVKGHAGEEHDPAVLDRFHPPRGEAAAVADALHVVDDRLGGIARQQEVAVHGMGDAVLGNRAHGGDQGLPQHLPAIHPLPTFFRPAASEQVLFERLQVQYREQMIYGLGLFGLPGGHGGAQAPGLGRCVGTRPAQRAAVKIAACRTAAMELSWMQSEKSDIVIVGGSFAGLALARALALALAHQVRITLVERQPAGATARGPARLCPLRRLQAHAGNARCVGRSGAARGARARHRHYRLGAGARHPPGADQL